MVDHRRIRVQKPLHAVLRARLLRPFQPPARDFPRDAFGKADVGQVVYSCFVVSWGFPRGGEEKRKLACLDFAFLHFVVDDLAQFASIGFGEPGEVDVECWVCEIHVGLFWGEGEGGRPLVSGREGVVGGGGFEILLVDFRLFAGEEGRRGGRGELRI